MALGTPTALESAASLTVGAVSATSDAFSFTSGGYIFAFVNWQQGTTVPDAGTIDDSENLTWTQLYENTYDPGSGVRHRIRLYRAVSNGNSMTVTVTPATSGGTEVVLCSLIGVTGAAAYFGNTGFNASNTTANPSLTLSPRSNSTVIGWYFTNGGMAVSPPTNYTEIQEFTSGTGARIVECAYDAGSAAQSATWDYNSFEGALLLELREPLVLTAEPGSFALSGTDASLRAARKLTAAPGSFALTGTDAALRAARKLVAEAGSFTLTGADANFRRALRLNAEAGSFVLTGTDATFTTTAVDPEVGAYSRRQRRKRAGWSDYGRWYPGSRGLR